MLELSFNQLSDLKSSIGVIAQSCPRIHDIQLHDNPLTMEEGFAMTVIINFPCLVEYDGNVVQEDHRWLARSQAMSGYGHLLIPMLQELAR